MLVNIPKIDKSVIDRLKKLDTTCASDACDSLGIVCGLHGIKPVLEGKQICGQAFTVHYVPVGTVKGTVGDFLDDVEPGQVVVLDNAGRDYCTVWGDIMALTASIKRIEGTLIDGVCRDIPALKKIGYPIFSKGYYMVTGKDRVMVDAVNVNISVSGVQVKPGDVIFGDDTGAIVIPYERVIEVLEISEKIAQTEALIEKEVRNGLSLKEAREKLHYHTLQSKK